MVKVDRNISEGLRQYTHLVSTRICTVNDTVINIVNFRIAEVEAKTDIRFTPEKKTPDVSLIGLSAQ